MRRLLPFLFLISAIPLFAQPSQPSIILVGTAPSGPCTVGLPNQQVASTGALYSCQNGTWGQIGGGGGMVYPGAGVAVSTGSAWGTSIDPLTLALGNSFTSNHVITGNGGHLIQADPTCIIGAGDLDCTSFNNVPLTAAGSASLFLNKAGLYTTPSATLVTPNIAAVYGFGTSIVQGGGVDGHIGQFAMFSMLASMTTALPFNYGQNSSTAEQDLINELTLYSPSFNAPQLIYVETGENNPACSTGACNTHFTNQYSFMDAWAAIPPSFQILATTATLSGGWGTDGGLPQVFQPTLTATRGNATSTTTNGATATFSIPSSASTVVGLSYLVVNSATGTFTVSVDGTNVTDNCSGTTTFSSAPCLTNIGSTSTVYRQDWPVTPGGTHTIIVTSTNTGEKTLIGADWIPPANIANLPLVFHGSVLQGFPSFTSLNVLSLAVAAHLNGLGLKDYYVDYTNGTPGINATTDVAYPATKDCSGTTIANHPNTCGQLHGLQTVQNVAAANGINLGVINSSGSTISATGSFTGPVNSIGRPGLSNNWNNMGATSGNPTGTLVFADTGGNGFGYGFMIDASGGHPWSGNYNTLMFTSSNVASYNCFGNFTHGASLDSASSFTATACVAGNTGNFYTLGTVNASNIGISNAITSATGGSGTGTITCATATCTNLRGSYTIAGGTFATGTLLTLVWPTTTTAYVCTAVVLNNATGSSIGYHSVATATGMTISSLTAATGLSVDIDYSCQL